MAGVMKTEAARGVGGVPGATLGASKVVGTARDTAEVGEAGDEGATQVLVIRPPRVVV
jgi:hypothetical protein